MMVMMVTMIYFVIAAMGYECMRRESENENSLHPPTPAPLPHTHTHTHMFSKCWRKSSVMEYLLSRKWSGLGNLTVSGLTIQVPREAVGRKKAHLKDGS